MLVAEYTFSLPSLSASPCSQVSVAIQPNEFRISEKIKKKRVSACSFVFVCLRVHVCYT